MTITDLDEETRRVLFWAHIVSRRSTPESLGKLTAALKRFDDKHAEERENNLIRAIFEVDQ